MSGVLKGIADSRTSSERTMSTVRTVRTATEEGSRSFGQIETAVADADGWTSAIQRAAISTNDLSRELRTKLDTLATGTESFAAAMQQVAASSEEQSASTEEIAAAAGTLAVAAERLGKLVANLRITDEHPLVPPTAESPTTPQRPVTELGLRRPLTAQ
jgi:methyl-accepting chemotaxis protein